LAQNIGSSLRKGDRVVVTGKLQLRQWTDEDGRHGTAPEIIADSVGHDLKWGTAKFARSTESRLLADAEGQGEDLPGAGRPGQENVDLGSGEIFDDPDPEEDGPGAGGNPPDGSRMAG
ncbi:single-stranded DNA-binding protein, partial [Arthrobacter deserti]|nr:single-stranded DNA-binding protein [Arthrobacter deserti]